MWAYLLTPWDSESESKINSRPGQFGLVYLIPNVFHFVLKVRRTLKRGMGQRPETALVHFQPTSSVADTLSVLKVDIYLLVAICLGYFFVKILIASYLLT